MNKNAQNKTVGIVGVPSDLGANIRGANMGPAAIRIAGLKKNIEQIGYKCTDWGDLQIPVRDALPQEIIDQQFLGPITDLCGELEQKTYDLMSKEQIPLTIGGDHSIAIGSVSGVSRFFKEQNQDMGLIWVDAHADINTPDSSESGNIHGMPLATLLNHGHSNLTSIGFPGLKVNPKKVALIGIRTIDAIEKEILRTSGISYYTMRDLDERGMSAVMNEAIEITGNGSAGIHLSFDIDGIDPLYAPGVSTPVTGGLSFREAHLLLEILAESGKLCSMDFVELNPFTDKGPKSAHLTVDLILSALGKSIV